MVTVLLKCLIRTLAFVVTVLLEYLIRTLARDACTCIHTRVHKHSAVLQFSLISFHPELSFFAEYYGLVQAILLGAVESIRIIFAQGGVKYEGIRFEGEDWGKNTKQVCACV